MRIQIANLLILFILISSCDKFGTSNYQVTGKVQKGPFSKGSDITLFEMENNLQQTGKSFFSSINSDDGSFDFGNIALNRDFVLIETNGYYFSEIFGELSPAPISLQSIVDISESQEVNVNVLTHLTRKRIENLVSEGRTFQEAQAQAESELLIFLGVSEPLDYKFEELDISRDSEQDAVLLALSVIIQRYAMETSEKNSLPAELTSLLTEIKTDFGDDGRIDQSIIDTLLHNISAISMPAVRVNIETRYELLGGSITIPAFEEYVEKFQKKYSNNVYTDFFYPEMASPEPLINPQNRIPNILYPQLTEYQADPYSMAAIIPIGSALTIKFIVHPGSSEYPYAFAMIDNGWIVENNYPDGIVLNSQKNNELMSLLFYLENWGTASLEYYEDESETPTFTKELSWGVEEF